MYDLFNSTYRGNSKFTPIIKLRTNRAVIQRELVRVCSFYRSRPIDVKSEHVIVQLINILNVSVKRNSESIVRAVVERTPDVAKTLGLLHPYNNKPVERVGVFYNDFVKDIIILDETTHVDYDIVKKHWGVLNAIQIVTHPYNDINFHLCNGKYPYSNPGYAVFVINVQLLILQYREWVKDRQLKGIDDTRVRRFVGQCVIPNMLGCHMDICYINRAMDSHRGRMVPVMRRTHPVSIVDITKHVDDTIDSQLKILNDGVKDIHNFYSCFPGIVKENWLTTITLPDIAPNQNVRWAMSLSVIPYISFMVDYYHACAPSNLSVIKQRINRSIRSIDNNKEFKSITVTSGGNSLANIISKLN